MFERRVFSSFFPWPCVCYYSFTFPRKEEEAQHEPACPSFLLDSTPVTIHSESPPFVCILLCCHVLPPPLLQEKDNGRPRTETHAKYTPTDVESAGSSNHSRNHIHNGLHHISMWSSTSSALDVHLPGIGARTRSFDLFVCCWSFSSGFECGFIHMYDPPYADEQSPPLALCVLLCCECPRTLPLIRTCLQRHHCLFVVVICHTL